MRDMIGFSLIELLVCIAILAIFTTVAVPSYSALVQRQEMTTAVNGMVHLLNLARMEAIKRQTFMTICPTADNKNCSTDWNLPLMLFEDPNKDEHRTDNEQLLRVLEPRSSTQWTANRNYVQYQASGLINGTNASLVYCPQSGEARYARRIIINIGGRVRLSADRDGDGIHEGSNGAALSCI